MEITKPVLVTAGNREEILKEIKGAVRLETHTRKAAAGGA
jgi:hypothetical protein